MPSSPITISSERSTQQPHHALGPHPEAAQVVRQPVGVRIQRRVAQRTILKHHRDRIRRRAPPAPQTARAASRPAPHAPSRSSPPAARARSAAASISSAADRAHPAPQPPPPADESDAPPAPQRSTDQTGRWRIPACRRCPPAHRPPSARLQKAQRQVELRARGRDRLIARRTPRPAPAQPARCSGTPASPGTAGAATATAPG